MRRLRPGLGVLVAIALAASPAVSAAALPACNATLALHDHTGLCTTTGRTLHFAAANYMLDLKTLTAKVENWHTATKLSSQYGGSASPRGVFLVLSVRVTNNSDGPQSYQENQTALIIVKSVYTESFEAENGPDQSSLLWQDTSQNLQPGESETGDLDFDVPAAAAAEFKRGEAALVFGNYGDDVTQGFANGIGLIYF